MLPLAPVNDATDSRPREVDAESYPESLAGGGANFAAYVSSRENSSGETWPTPRKHSRSIFTNCTI